MTDQNFERIENDVREIKDAILGTGMYKENGLIDKQKRLETRVDNHDRVLWMGGGILLFISAIIGIIELFDKINIKI